MTRRKEWFVKLNEVNQERIKFANDSCLTAERNGWVVLKNYHDNEVILEGVLYMPGLETNLLSFDQLFHKGFRMIFGRKFFVFVWSDQKINHTCQSVFK